MIRTQTAKTLQLTARQFAISQWPSAIMLLVNVNNVTQQRIRTAHRLKELVERNANHHNRKLSATTALENAAVALMDKDVLRKINVINLARKCQRMKLMPVTGPNHHQPVNKIQRVLLTRKHVLNNAKLHHSVSATSRLACVSNANKVNQNASKLLISVKQPTRKSISAKLRHLMAYTE
jgi:hypothetical protein